MLFTDIPYEVLTGSLLPFLDIPDVLHLGGTCVYLRKVSLDQHYWRQLTLKTFRLPPQPIRQKGWHELYRRLSTAKAFSWGSNEFGRLGHSYETARATQLTLSHRSPTEIETLRNEVVVDIRCGGWSTWALTSQGKVYGWGKLEGDQLRGSVVRSPHLVDFGEPIDRIAVGRRCCFALAESGKLHVVDIDFTHSATVKLTLSYDAKEYPSKEHPILHFAVGWRHAAAVIEGIGLVVWKSDVPQPQIGDVNVKDRSCRARHIIRIEELDESASDTQIIGLMVGEGYLVYLTEAGTVYRVALDDEILEARDCPTSFFLENFHTTPKLSYLSGSFRHFGLFNTVGQVLIGNVTSKADEAPVIMSDLQKRGIIGLSWGDWHGLALCEDGSILSWGKELRANGCLGLGYQDYADAQEKGLLIDALSGEVVSTVPRRIPGFGGEEDKFAFCVAAAGWHSAALVANFKVQELAKRQW